MISAVSLAGAGIFVSLARADCVTLPKPIAYVNEQGRVALRKNCKDPPLVSEAGRSPKLSPDGNRVAFWQAGAKWKKEGSSLKIWNVGTGKVERLIDGETRNPSWSEDGKWILFSKLDPEGWGTYLTPSDHSAPKVFFVGQDPLKHEIYDAAWLPASTAIVAHDMQSLYWVSLDGKITRSIEAKEIPGIGLEYGFSQPFPFLPNPRNPDLFIYSYPHERSDRLQAAFNRVYGWYEVPNTVFLYDFRSGKREALTGDDMNAIDPSWSDDGKSVLFHGDRVIFRGRSPKQGEVGVYALDLGTKKATFLFPGSEPN